MKILIAPDSFKEALPAPEVCRAIQQGVSSARPDADCILFPLADGGEGTSEILAWHLKGEMIRLTVAGPLGQTAATEDFANPHAHARRTQSSAGARRRQPAWNLRCLLLTMGKSDRRCFFSRRVL